MLAPQRSGHTLTGHRRAHRTHTPPCYQLSEVKAARPAWPAGQAVFQHLLAPTAGSAPRTALTRTGREARRGCWPALCMSDLALTCARDAGPDCALGVACLFPPPVPSCHSVHVPARVRVPPRICCVSSWTNALSPVFSQMPSQPCTPALGPSRPEPQTQKPPGPASAQLLPALLTCGAGSHSSWAQVSW